jgi:hypothetical protein
MCVYYKLDRTTKEELDLGTHKRLVQEIQNNFSELLASTAILVTSATPKINYLPKTLELFPARRFRTRGVNDYRRTTLLYIK